MSAIASALSGWRRIDDFAAGGAWAVRLDPRAKTLSAVAVLIAMAGSDHYAVAGLLPYAALPLCLMVGARIPLRWLMPRVAIALPFAVMIGLLNPWLDAALWASPWGTVSAGWLSFMSIMLRCVISVSIALLLLACTGMGAFTQGLAYMGVPRVLTMQMQILYRYFFVIGEELSRMLQARQLRAPGAKRRMSLALARQILGTLFYRASDRGLRVHGAMMARGFTGALPPARPLRWRLQDSAWLAFWLGFALIVYRYAPFLAAEVTP